MRRVLQQIGNNWRRARVSDYPDMCRQRSEETYSLLIKPRAIHDEEVLFRFLTSIMNLNGTIGIQYVLCDSYWKRDSEHKDLIYLWIRKDRFDEIIQKLGLKITS